MKLLNLLLHLITVLPYWYLAILSHIGINARVKFDGGCLKQDKITFTHGKTVNIYIVYECFSTRGYDNYPVLEKSLLGAVKLVKNADIDKYKYSEYGIGFDRRGSFLVPNGGFGQNVIIFIVDISSSIYIDNKEKIF